jgi:hypothetical protein
MFRANIIVLAIVVAAGAALGTSSSLAVPLKGVVIAATGTASESVQQVSWFRPRYRRHSVAARGHWRDDICYQRGRRGDPRLFMRQQASGCF